MSAGSDRKGAGAGLWEQAPAPESDEATHPTGGRGGRAEVAPGDDTPCGGQSEPAGAGGAAASYLIGRMPAANPTRPFPKNLFKPLVGINEGAGA